MLDRADALQIYGVKDELAVYDRVNKTITEEANLSHSGGKLDWIVGAFYLHSKGRQLAFETQQYSATRLPYTPTFDPASDEAVALYAAGLSFVSRDNSNRTSAAVYGQATYHFTDSLRLTGGARYSYDKYTDDAELFFGAPETNVSKFTKVTGNAAVEFDPWLDALCVLLQGREAGWHQSRVHTDDDTQELRTGVRAVLRDR
jgi:iron complex outermembrane receptor protein